VAGHIRPAAVQRWSSLSTRAGPPREVCAFGTGRSGPVDLLGQHQAGRSGGVGGAGVEDVQVGEHDVTRRPGQLDDLDRHAVDLGSLTDQRPAVVR